MRGEQERGGGRKGTVGRGGRGGGGADDINVDMGRYQSPDRNGGDCYCVVWLLDQLLHCLIA